MNKNEKIILGITGFSHLSVHILMLIFPALFIVVQKEFNLGMGQLGLMASISAFMFGAGAIPAGYFESKIGGRSLLLVYLLGTGLFSIGMIWVHSIFMLSIFLGFMGLLSSIYHPAGLTLISHRVKHLSKGMAYHGIAGSIGLAIGPLFASILSESFYWQMPYIVMGVLNLFLSIVVLVMIPISKSNSSEREIDKHPGTNKQGLFYYYGFSMTMGFVFGGFSTFMPAHFGQHTQEVFPFLSPVIKGGLFTSLVFSAGAIGQIMGGYTGLRYPKPLILMWVAILNIPVLFLMGLTTGIPLVFVSLFLGVFYFTSQPVGNALVADLTHHGHRGIGYGISFFLSFGIGGVSAAAGGWLAEMMNISTVFIFMGFALFPAVFFAKKLSKKVNP
ncbi:MAG: MFS transporter [Candidatus Marinimicrobia bacterium]|nr:MFS transporter [Candidatus Neomarinimicrobiota bacterium]